MKIKKLTTAMAALGFVAASGMSSAVGFNDESISGPIPKLTKAEEGAFALAETLLSITAAFVTANGCGPLEGSQPYKINVAANGTGNATYPKDVVNGITLAVYEDSAVDTLGTKYKVTSPDTRQYVGTNSISDYYGDLNYSSGGAILISNSDFYLYEFGAPFPWDEHNIKDFWLAADDNHESSQWCRDGCNEPKEPNGAHIKDYGLEVITKDWFPLTKWRQNSDHWRWNYPRPDGSVGPGQFTANKWLISPYDQAECHIRITGVVNGILGRTDIDGSIVVSEMAAPPSL